MPRISDKNKERIQEQILLHLYTIFPKQVFTADVARELVRDEEFIKTLLIDLAKKGLVVKINKNPKGINYKVRLRWRLSNQVHEKYKQSQ
jgi:predicted transcriptional regulator with HTH domain